jgi:hypothetical protein
MVGFSREVAVLDHLALLQQRQQAAGLPMTPIPTAAEIAAAAEAEAKEKEAKAKAAAAAAAAKKAAPAKEVKE